MFKIFLFFGLQFFLGMSGELAVVCDSGTMHDLRTNFSKNNALLFTDSLTRPDSNDVDFVRSHDDGFEHCSFLTLYLF